MCCRGVKYHEPEYWKFGDEGNKYFRHATGQIYAISKDLAAYISINQLLFPDGHIYILNCVMCGRVPLCLMTYVYRFQADPAQVRERGRLAGRVAHRARGRARRRPEHVLRDASRYSSTSSLTHLHLVLSSAVTASLLHPISVCADCEWKKRAGNVCVASFDWSCSGVCKSVDRMRHIHKACGEGEGAVWNAAT
jgi:hypothetical protein